MLFVVLGIGFIGNIRACKESEIKFDENGKITNFVISPYYEDGSPKDAAQVNAEVYYCLNLVMAQHGYENNPNRYLKDAIWLPSKNQQPTIPINQSSSSTQTDAIIQVPSQNQQPIIPINQSSSSTQTNGLFSINSPFMIPVDETDPKKAALNNMRPPSPFTLKVEEDLFGDKGN